METRSVVINKIIGAFVVLNKYFEYSFVFSAFSFIGGLLGKSNMVKAVKGFVLNEGRDYAGGSAFLGALTGAFGALFRLMKAAYIRLSDMNKKSFNKAVFDTFIPPLKSADGLVSAVLPAFSGLFGVFAVYLFMSGYGIKRAGLCGGLCIAFFYTGFFLSGEIAAAVKKSMPCRLLAAFFFEVRP